MLPDPIERHMRQVDIEEDMYWKGEIRRLENERSKMKVFVNRYSTNANTNSTQGNLIVTKSDNVVFTCDTLERAWLDNKPNESCIPSGIYTLSPYHSPNHGDVLTFIGGSVSPHQEDVTDPGGPGAARWGCHVHAANYPLQLNGCLAPGGSKSDDHEGAPAVWNSRNALNELLEVITQPIICYVRWLTPTGDA